MTHIRVRWRWIAGILVCLALHLFLQTLWAHRTPPFLPAGEDVSLLPVLTQASLSWEDYDMLFLQTGLSPDAVDRLLSWGEAGVAQIIETQRIFRHPGGASCKSLIPGRITCEDLLEQPGVPLAPLEPGDLLVSFSTHTEGWRHGHAGLVINGGEALEAAKLGETSGRLSLSHWRTYSTLLVLRVRAAGAEERDRAVRFALDRLEGAPYSFFAGFGPVKELGEGAARVQCAYLPWSAWQFCGYDLDADGGRIVTVGDLAASPLLEVVQVYGIDPAEFLGRTAGGV